MASILLVEDENDLRDVVRRTLEGAGHRVREAVNGEKALAAFHADPPDLVITDIIMPNKDGLAFIAALRGAHPQARIIAMSGGGRARFLDLLSVAEKAGANFALAKPFRKSELLACVERVLASP